MLDGKHIFIVHGENHKHAQHARRHKYYVSKRKQKSAVLQYNWTIWLRLIVLTGEMQCGILHNEVDVSTDDNKNQY